MIDQALQTLESYSGIQKVLGLLCAEFFEEHLVKWLQRQNLQIKTSGTDIRIRIWNDAHLKMKIFLLRNERHIDSDTNDITDINCT